ncbi:MarR family winged helix-turn-helix transcriptional regulator [Nonomuraea sp. NPDC050556]|uniref:MarR family winged helix-turn-helix transcriptional regulator n=1 Tax=Nonomuraea sp. NPDC050556 TaxID=3364369 RepID=UPI0037981EA7
MQVEPMRDAVDEISDQWARTRPDLDMSPMHVVGRLFRASRLLDRGVKEFFTQHGLEPWEFDMLATLLRSNTEHCLCMKDLTANALVSPGALTNRMDRLVERGLVHRTPAPDNRRMVLVYLTPDGERLVNEIMEAHLAHERELLAGLSKLDQEHLATILRGLLHSLGDTAL